MATGTGKTFTALGCLDKLLDEESKLVIIISVPYQHLIQQWKRSIEQFGILSKIDKILTSKIFGIPIMILFLLSTIPFILPIANFL